MPQKTDRERAMELARKLQETDLILSNKTIRWLENNTEIDPACDLQSLDELCSELYAQEPVDDEDLTKLVPACADPETERELKSILMNMAHIIRENVLKDIRTAHNITDMHLAVKHIRKTMDALFAEILLQLKDNNAITRDQYVFACESKGNQNIAALRSDLNKVFHRDGSIKPNYASAEALFRLLRCNLEALEQISAMETVVPAFRRHEWQCPACDWRLNPLENTQTCPNCGRSLVYPKISRESEM